MTVPLHVGDALSGRRAGHDAPMTLARVGGALYLVIIVIGFLGEAVVRGPIGVASAAATTANLRLHETLWRAGIAGELVLLVCAVALAPILYALVRPVNRQLALGALCFNLVSLSVEASSSLHLVAALAPIGRAGYLAAFSPEQLHAMTSMAIRSHGQGFGIALVFFGCTCLLLGYLIYRSGYLPRAIGVLMLLAGLSYLLNSFALILSPALAGRLFPAVLLPALVGEGALCLWLLVKGVDADRWNAVRA